MACYIIFILLLGSVLTINVAAQDRIPPHWNENWSYIKEINLPISTESPYAKYQPIDIGMEFENPCWALNENKHSIRVVCWDGSNWHELESQIYDMNYKDSIFIKKCGLIFLVPKIANGEERYFVYYDDTEKPSLNYADHVSVEDAYHYYEPISGVSVEGDYYKITEDGNITYGVGQKGQLVYRPFSQGIIKTKLGSKDLDITNYELISAFTFSYHLGDKDEDEIASDAVLVSKGINVDGNLMVEFGIESRSSKNELRTTNIYKYYYCPTPEKRISVHVKHQVLNETKVKGIINVDGRYGGFGSIKFRSARLKNLNFGEILPYLHVYGENNKIKEYRMETDPESNMRDWIISYKDDCDVGEKSWISYDMGERGKAHAIIFSSNKGFVKSGTNERDGISVKVAEREYLDLIGTEADYASISFGRNSYEIGETHDLDIPDDLVVEFDAEFFTSEEGGYDHVVEESKIYRELIKHRHSDDGFEEDPNIHVLTVIPRFTGRIFSYPRLASKIDTIPTIEADLYKDDVLISKSEVKRPIPAAPRIRFTKLPAGEYLVKIYRRISENVRNYIGVEFVTLEDDKTIDVYCTWQKNIDITYFDQYERAIEYIDLVLLRGDTVVTKNLTGCSGKVVLNVPINLFKPYKLIAFYKGFKIYENEILFTENNVEINLDLFDLTVEVKDDLELDIGVDVRPTLTSPNMYIPLEIEPDDVRLGRYLFKNLPAAPYLLSISYAGLSDEKTIDIPKDGDFISMKFSARFNLNMELFNSRGEQISNKDKKTDIVRRGRKIFDSVSTDKTIILPPGIYTLNVYFEGKLIGIKTIELTSDRNVKIVTTIESILPVFITWLVIIFIVEMIILFLIKKLSLNTFLKVVAMSLILISIFQPWWALSSINGDAEKTSEMFIVPQTMIDTITYKNTPYLELATIPEVFTNFLGILLFIVCSGFVLLGISFIPNIVLKRRYYGILISASIIFLLLVAIAFSFGMSIITEISLGSLQGEAVLEIVLPNGQIEFMATNWGFGNGFYLCIFSAFLTLFTGILDYLRKVSWPKAFLRKILLYFNV